jgi:aspartyl-tRNA(Asn)/glutamyl-tRNA(Gln) amidotransferase subunit A
MNIPTNLDPSQRGLCALSARQLGALYRAGRLSPVDVVNAVLERIERLNPQINAFRLVLDDSAISAAQAAEVQLASRVDLGPLHGIPVSVKDNIRVRGTRTMVGSPALAGVEVDEEDATLVRRLRSAGAILIGKVNCDEFAAGTPDPELPGATVQNPRRWGHRPGGSSSGSAAAVACGLGVISVGTDTGGSIRHPASVCGVVGLRPTHGLVGMDGVVPFSPRFDVAGPLARSVDDVDVAFAALTRVSSPRPTGNPAAARHGPTDSARLDGLRIGIPTNPMYRDGEEDALALLDGAVTRLIEAGMRPSSLHLPRADELIDISNILMLPDLKRTVDQFGPDLPVGRELGKRLWEATQVSPRQYLEAAEAQADIRDRWSAVFDRIDVLALPANLAGAPMHGEELIRVRGRPLDFRRVLAGSNRAASITGQPALTLPIGSTAAGLPIGIQLLTRPLAERLLLRVGRALESLLGHPAMAWGIEPVGLPPPAA